MSSAEARILAILESILETDMPADVACRGDPDLLPEVLDRLERARLFGAHLDAMLPRGTATSRTGRTELRRLATKLPEVPGYTIEGVVGYGGVGVVYRARQVKLNRVVAIKMLLAGGYAGPLELQRFKREAESIASLCHPNIVQVFDAGECDGHPYFVMEFMDGGSLAQALGGNPQPARAAAEQVLTLARAVHAAHTAGIMHRDLKPANILLNSAGVPKIADFGLARRSDQSDAPALLTLAGARMGTPSYMAPEQALGAASAFCPLVDIYALGALLYEMLTGRPPFRGDSPAETERQVIAEEPVPPARLNPKAPRDLQTICLTCLQKDPRRRYASAADLADDLERLLRGDPIRARPVSVVERAAKWGRRRPAAAALIVTLVTTLAGAVGAGAWIQEIETTRRTDATLRRLSATNAVESALSLVEELQRGERWSEAEGILNTARSRLADAGSAPLEVRLESAASDLAIARELDRIRQSYAEPNLLGFNFTPAQTAYAQVFARCGIGPGSTIESAAAIVRASRLRAPLLVALDNAAFIELLTPDTTELRRLCAVARLADPDPWRDRFRDPSAWRDRAQLLGLVRDARAAPVEPPSHQLVLLAVLLNGLGERAETVRILRDAQYRNPSDFWVNLELGNALERAERHAESIQFYRAALAVHPENFVLWATLGTVIRVHGSPEDAIPPIRKSVELNPGYVRGWQNLVLAYLDCERWDQASAAYRRAFELKPQDHEMEELACYSAVIHARACAGAQQWSEASDQYALAVDKKRPEDGELWFEYAAVQLLAGNAQGYHKAREHMLELATTGRTRKYLVARAFSLEPGTAQDLSEPARLGTEELQGSPTGHWSLTEQGALLCRMGQTSDAVPLFERSIQASPRAGDAIINWAWLALAHAQLGHTATARDWIAKAVSWINEQGGRKPDSKVIHLHNWLEALVVQREAQTMLDTIRPTP